MKRYMQPLNPSSIKHSKSSSRKQKHSNENAPPPDVNAISDSFISPSITGKPSPVSACKVKSPLPPRPPPSSSLKRKLSNELPLENGVAGSSDTGVKVIVRMRPPSKNEEDGEIIVQKTSGDSLSILGQPFTFDSIVDASSTQVDIFQMVGAPLVENCIAGLTVLCLHTGRLGVERHTRYGGLPMHCWTKIHLVINKD